MTFFSFNISRIFDKSHFKNQAINHSQQQVRLNMKREESWALDSSGSNHWDDFFSPLGTSFKYRKWCKIQVDYSTSGWKGERRKAHLGKRSHRITRKRTWRGWHAGKCEFPNSVGHMCQHDCNISFGDSELNTWAYPLSVETQEELYGAQSIFLDS